MKKLFLLFAAALLAATCPAGVFAQFKIGGKKIDAGKLLNAGKDVAKAVTLNDEEIARLSRESVEWMDANNPVAADSTTYGARLKRLTEGITDADGLPLNFKVYLVTDVNAFACGDGSIRVFEFCVKHGFDPYGMANSLDKLVELSKGAKASTVQKMFSSHPDSEKRAARMKEKADAYMAAQRQNR